MTQSDIAISVREVSKSYVITHQLDGPGGHRTSFRDAITNRLRNSFRKKATETFWALKEVTFEVNKGDVVGIIGRNGAGKSTLLKILSRIVKPSSGEIDVYGRIGSLLEVGTGFHPELTGRENIFLNGAILGMRRSEIRRQFAEIVDFAEIEKFLDTPVKRYSSGMYVRLAFAVAAHLNPEILIVDEVLAVGDAEFQKKCLGKMKAVSTTEGRTVLFVSHNMEAVKQLCTKAILMDQGKISYGGGIMDAVKEYQDKVGHHSVPIISGTGAIKLIDFDVRNSEDEEVHTFNTFDEVTFQLRYRSFDKIKNVSFAIGFDDASGKRVVTLWSSFQNKTFDIDRKEFQCNYHVRQVHLRPGIYSLVLFVEANGSVLERIDNYTHITVGYVNDYGLVKLPESAHGTYIEHFTMTIA